MIPSDTLSYIASLAGLSSPLPASLPASVAHGSKVDGVRKRVHWWAI